MFPNALRCAVLALAIAVLSACESPPPAVGGVTELGRTELQPGSGEPVERGDLVSVHYTGWVYDQSKPDRRGTQFDSSRDRQRPFSFTLGEGRVIRGWDEGVVGMRVGEKVLLAIPAAMAYGDRGAGRVIPPGASLLFEIELLDVTRHR